MTSQTCECVNGHIFEVDVEDWPSDTLPDTIYCPECNTQRISKHEHDWVPDIQEIVVKGEHPRFGVPEYETKTKSVICVVCGAIEEVER